jgi:GT2 family glycosyltransferase
MDLTVIIPTFNNQEILTRVLDGLYTTIPLYSPVIVVDDGSDKPITYKTDKNVIGLQILRHKQNRGVGTAFDTGVKAAYTEGIVLMGSDVFVPPDWYSKTMAILNDYPLSITCSVCSGFSGEQKPFREKRALRYGAHILRTHDLKFPQTTMPDIIQAQWNSGKPEFGDDIVAPVGCILGAFYVTTKTVYNAVGGFMGHKIWGGLEPMISIRAKRMGYKLYVARDLETAHNFGRVDKTKERPSHWDIYFYNKLMMAETMFECPCDIKDYLYTKGTNQWLQLAERLVRKSGVEDIRTFYQQHFTNGLIKEGEEL